MPPANDSPAQFYASRPTIKIDGAEQRELGETLLQSLLIEETTLGLFRCEARFANWGASGDRVDFYLFDGRIVDFGKEIEVELGPPGGARRVFKGRISGLEAHFPKERPPELTVLAEDRFQDLRMERRTRTFEDSSDSDAMNAIISQHGLTAEISRCHDPRGEAVPRKPNHTIRADFVAAHLTPRPFVETLDDLVRVVARHRARINPAVFPPRIAWSPDDDRDLIAAE